VRNPFTVITYGTFHNILPEDTSGFYPCAGEADHSWGVPKEHIALVLAVLLYELVVGSAKLVD
jgi:hypothetical protein